jgi:hypothetical protein
MSKLKPCPFCGTVPKNTSRFWSFCTIDHDPDCYLYNDPCVLKSDLPSWNRRAIGVEKRTKAKRAGR